MNAARGPPGQARVARVIVVAGGRVELGLRAAEGTRASARLGGSEHPAGLGSLARGQRGRAVEQRGRLAPAAPAAGAFPGALELGRDLLVRAGDGLGQVPGPLVWLVRAGGRGEAGVDLLALGEGRPVVHRRADQRMAEADRTVNGDELPGFSGGSRLQGEAQFPARPGKQAGVPGGVSGRREQQGLGGGRQFPDLPQVALLEPAAQRYRPGRERVAVQPAAGELPPDLDERQRVAARLSDDLVGDRAAQPRPGRGREQGASVLLRQPGQAQLREPGQPARRRRGLPDGKDDGDGVGVQAPRHERQDIGRLLVQAVRVIDQAQQGLAGGLPGQQPQRGQADEKTMGHLAFGHAEGQAERGLLRCRQDVEGGQEGPQQLVHSREAELHLALDAVDPDDLQVRRGRLCVIQERRLAHARLAPQRQDGAAPLACSGHDLIQAARFRISPEQALHGANLLPGVPVPAWLSRPHVVTGPGGLRAPRDARPATAGNHVNRANDRRLRRRGNVRQQA
jgi:hypothetical protein